jgi:LDH2 family malate/lactate/ureidoglycolate dehydrogenase
VFGLLAGTLHGAAMGKDVIDFNHDDSSATNTGQALLAIDPAAFGDPLEFRKRVDVVVRDLRASERMPGVQRIWLPGEQSHMKRQDAASNGMAIGAGLRKSLDALADELRIPRLTGGST